MLEVPGPFGVGPDVEHAVVLRRWTDRSLLQSLRYLAERATIGGLHVGAVPPKLDADEDVLIREPSARLRPLAFELHRLVHVALLEGAAHHAQQLFSLVGAASFVCHGRATRAYSSGPGRFEAGVEPDDIFMQVISREYELTSSGPADVWPPSQPGLELTRKHLAGGLELLALADPKGHDEVAQLVTEITVIGSRTVKAGTSIRSYGRVWLIESDEADDRLTRLEAVVHETAHLYLYLIQLHDPLLLNGAEAGFASPFRLDPRPLSGLYHAMFVLARTLRALRLLRDHSAVVPLLTPSEEARFAFVERLSQKFAEVEAVLRKHAELTPVGRALLEGCSRLVRDESLVP